MTDESIDGAHDRPARRRLAAAAVVLCALFACRREPPVRAASFGASLAAPLPHADVLGFVCGAPADVPEELFDGLAVGGVDLARVGVLAPALTMVSLARDHVLLAPGAPLAVLFLDADVHGGVAAFAWRGDAATLRAAAAAAQIPFDRSGRLLLPGRGRARDIELASDAMRQRSRRVRNNDDDDELPDEVMLREGGARVDDTPRLPYSIVEREGVVLLLPARDGERNLFDTLAATGMLDADRASLPCLRLATGRLTSRFRDVLGGMFNVVANRLMSSGYSPDDASSWRARVRIWRVVDALLDAIGSVEELFLCRDGGEWRAALRFREGSFGASLLDVVQNRPLAELLTDVPADSDFLAVQFDPAVLREVPELWSRSREGFFRRRPGTRGPPSRLRESDDQEQREEADRANAFFDSVTGRCWFTGTVDRSKAATRGKEGDSAFSVDAIGETRLAAFFARKPDAEGVGFATTLVDTLVPKGWRAPIKLGAILVYRPVAVENGVVEVIAREPDRFVRETIAQMRPRTPPPTRGRPERAFLAWRRSTLTPDLLSGDLFATRVGLSIDVVFLPAAP